MSALFGLINLNGQEVAQTDLERMRAALVHHGDEGGAWWRQNAGMGQRLTCFTPEDRLERQPLVSADGQRILISNARLDNRHELALALDISPAEASALPDSVFILRAFEKWGEDCMRRLIGSFLFAIWDARMQRLFAARSPFGGRTLFYYATPHTLSFATMPKALLTLPYISRTLNEEKVADFLVLNHAEIHTTFYRNVYRLPPGHLLTFGREGLNTRRYFHFDLKREIRFPHDDDYVEAFNELFERVVNDQLRSLTPVGVMMSGGLDSASVAVTAARLLQREDKRLTTFTEVPRAGFDGPVIPRRYADETPFVQAIAQMYPNLDPRFIRTDGRDPFQDLNTFFDHVEIPFRNVANRVWIEAVLHSARACNTRVLLTGDQGNLTVSWDGSGLLPQFLRKGQWAQAWREARALAREGNAQSAILALAGRGLLPLLPTPVWLAVEWLRGRHQSRPAQPWRAYSSIHPDFAAEQRVDARARAMGNNFHRRITTDTRALRYEVITTMDVTGDMGSGYQALYGVQKRAPLMDARLIDFCFALPEEQYQRNGITRWLIRRAMAKSLPSVVLENKKRGLQAADWYERLEASRDEMTVELERLEQSELARRTIDIARLRRLLEQFPSSGWNKMQTLIDYRSVLESGIMVGRYLRWFEAGG